LDAWRNGPSRPQSPLVAYGRTMKLKSSCSIRASFERYWAIAGSTRHSAYPNDDMSRKDRCWSCSGTSRLRDFAVLRLMTNSKSGRCLHWKVRRIVAFENSINIGCAPSEQVERIYSVRYQAALGGIKSKCVYARQSVTGRHGTPHRARSLAATPAICLRFQVRMC
jgi:hypothetical protein